ncbi:MAG TPA: DUF1287 domain-containing protein [Chthoniobacteraceae bacterium]|jgi:hypothetical protein
MSFRALAVLFLIFLSSLKAPAEETQKLLAAARAQIGKTLSYDPAYVKLSYPGGDVPEERGVCTDVVVRAFRGVGIDLQKEVHEDMTKSWSAYPKLWDLRRPDPNIDHRRVPNLMTFFKRQGKSLPVTTDPADYRAGDLVTCLVPPRLPHIMIVSDAPSPEDPKRRLVIHNIGRGAQLEDRLFAFQLTGHYRFW